MASRYVRTKIRDWLNLGTVKYYDTVNLEQNPTDAMWSTIDWGYGDRTTETYCRHYSESGAISIVFFGQPGIGDDALLAAAETEMELLMTHVDPAGRLTLEEYSTPIDFRQETYFCLEFMLRYEYRN